jgi:hypothetical protein
MTGQGLATAIATIHLAALSAGRVHALAAPAASIYSDAALG